MTKERSLVDRLKLRAVAMARVVLRDPRVIGIKAVADGVTAAGGPLLAAGLAFTGIFAILPALLFLVGVAGLFIADPEAREYVVAGLLERFPPLAAPVITETIEGLARNTGGNSLLGLLGMAWGASGFYGVLDEAMERLFPGGRTRSLLERRLRGVATIGLLIGLALAGFGLGALRSTFLPVSAGAPEELRWAITTLLTLVLIVLAVYACYRLVPTAPPDRRAALLPAIVAGLGIALLTLLYGEIAGRLVGALRAFGVLAALFGALIWLNYVFQLLMMGAAWARFRRDREEVRPPAKVDDEKAAGATTED